MTGGQPLDPHNTWGHDHLWWLDRMVRSDQPLSERMTLIWHSWFATSEDSSTAELMLRQNATMRHLALADFRTLLGAITRDPAMLLWLSGTENSKGSPNENYARELMELFTLGADRGYSQIDVHEQARALTGFAVDWPDSGPPRNFRFDPTQHDQGIKRIFGQRGRFDWRDSVRLCVEHPLHAGFMIRKLWGYFITEPLPPGQERTLSRVYVASGHQIRPLVEAILQHPLLFHGQRMVKPPVVFTAGLLRALGRGIDTEDWSWIAEQTGQRLFLPPNVAGWDYAHWLDTSRWQGRFTAVNRALQGHTVDPEKGSISLTESPEEALSAALAHWGHPELSAPTREHLLAFSRRAAAAITADWQHKSYRILRQNALRGLIPTTADWQTC